MQQIVIVTLNVQEVMATSPAFNANRLLPWAPQLLPLNLHLVAQRRGIQRELVPPTMSAGTRGLILSPKRVSSKETKRPYDRAPPFAQTRRAAPHFQSTLVVRRMDCASCGKIAPPLSRAP